MVFDRIALGKSVKSYQSVVPYVMKLLSEGARRLGLKLNEEHLRAFEIYYRELIAWNEKFNLTAITDYDQVQIKHFLDSLTCLLADEDLTRAICQQRGVRAIDIGAGAGLPVMEGNALLQAPGWRGHRATMFGY